MNTTFAHPSYLHALWLLPALVLLRVWAEGKGERTAGSMVAQRLRELLIVSASPLIAWIVFVLQLTALAGFVIALAQPRWGEEKHVVAESGRNVLLAIDTSKSMMADDVAPNRLMRAKLAAQDLVETLKEQRVGLIAFAGRAYLQAPLTTDHAAVIESLQSLDTFTIPRGGSATSEALREALEAFDKTKARNHGLILFSDGGENDAALDSMIAKLKAKRVMVITVGVGTEMGSLIPDPDPDSQGDYVRDPDTGNPVHSKLEESVLQKIAAETGGRYLKMGAQSLNNSVVLQTIQSLESLETGNREESKPIERFYWPLGAAIISLMLALMLRPAARLPRLSPALVAVLVAGLVPSDAKAVLTEHQSITEAQSSYEQQNYQRARDIYARLLAEEPPPAKAGAYAYGLGAAAHQLKDYDRAVEAFSRSLHAPDKQLQARAHRSLGNTLYEQGGKALQQQPDYTVKAWLDSISHYESALAVSNDKDARENLEFVRKQLQQLKQQMEEQKQQQQQKQQKGEKGEKGDKQKGEEGEGEPQDGEQGDQEKKDQEGKQGEQPKEGEGEQEKGKQGKGEEMEDGGKGPLPEGQIQAGEDGQPTDDQKQQQMQEMEGEQADERTGFSKNEARSLLRTYNDQMQLQFQQRRQEQQVKRNW
jgi:Ca-activated chloride channel family protein